MHCENRVIDWINAILRLRINIYIALPVSYCHRLTKYTYTEIINQRGFYSLHFNDLNITQCNT